MTTFYTSDLHVGHLRICELADRPFSSVEEMDAELVARWNARVGPDDTVVIVGDVAMGSLERSLEVVASLEGVKKLVPGNHDRVSALYHGSPEKRARWWTMYEAAGLEILSPLVLAQFGDVEALVCHFPYTGDSHGEDRYADARPIDHGQWLVHGHTHAKEKISGERQIHVGVDAWNFAPVSEDEVAELIATNS